MLGCTGRDGSSVSQTREGLPDQESWKVTITLTDAGVTRAIIRAGDACISESNGYFH